MVHLGQWKDGDNCEEQWSIREDEVKIGDNKELG
jgi:hypothetical protein